ncbi:hypothetical protein QR680_013239 [Steinernema hermaphroditum]|uniref:SH3 domain-containing protein n=1 Tax=Steinernema hermaphroditum TaxID=289476 RepID=A0AA39I4U2_9BILA|nr:hypothetical protein QR680_013239 [Steinernema hermaphroditum]
MAVFGEEERQRLRDFVEQVIPDGRQSLEDSCIELERVAAYCEANYAQAADKKAAFDQTKRYTIQSLASVAYFVNQLSSSLLQTLDLQTDKIGVLTGEVNKMNQVVNIHKEKIARREIGVLATNKCVQKQAKIITPAVQERAQRYQRTPIDYAVLDNIGHGVKEQSPQQIQPQSIVNRTLSTVSGSGSAIYQSTLPLDQVRGTATLSRSSMRSNDHYRVPLMTQIPTVDPARFSTVSTVPAQSNTYIQQPQGLPPQSQPIYSYSHSEHYGTLHAGSVPQQPSVLPNGQFRHSAASSNDGIPMPPPPAPATGYCPDDDMPPPPTSIEAIYEASANYVPRNYIEQAIALYDYEAEKEDELTLRENCMVYVVRKNEDGWYEGVLDGVTGLFPGNYVQPI